MKKLIPLFLALVLSGCVSIPLVTKSVENPVTKEALYATENALVIVVSGLNGYRRLCLAKQIDQSCRQTIVQIQGYTRPAAIYLKTARDFVRQNDQVNALTAYTTALALIADARQVATEKGAIR